MIQEIKLMISDIKSLKNIEAYILFFITFIVIIIDILFVVNTSILFELLLAVLAILLFMNIKIYRAIERQGAISSVPISRFYLRKADIPPFEDSITKAEKEFCLLGIHATNFLRSNEELLKSKLINGCKVRILIMAYDIDDNKINPNISHFGNLTKHPAVVEDLIASIKFIKIWLRDLDELMRENIEIRCYHTFPTSLYLMVDKELASGFIRVEPVLPYLKFHERPVFEIHHSDDVRLFNTLSNSFDEIWEDSSVLVHTT